MDKPTFYEIAAVLKKRIQDFVVGILVEHNRPLCPTLAGRLAGGLFLGCLCFGFGGLLLLFSSWARRRCLA